MANFLTCAAFLISFGCFSNAQILAGHSRWSPAKSDGLITVSGGPFTRPMRFTTIQAAINSVPSGNKDWVSIALKAAVYRERVTIPADKTFIYLKGKGMGRTVMVSGRHATMLSSATFESLADNVFVSGISFVNSYNYPADGKTVKPAVAAKVSGDKTAFYECGFLGYQDTLLDDKGRHYFKYCTIEGAVDFIFGDGQSIYEACNIRVNAGRGYGYIAAQGRDSPDDGGGFFFKRCNVTGKGMAYLGRAWKPYSRALYYQSFLSDIIVPAGWDSWTSAGHEDRLTFVEDNCQGPGSNRSNRVKWEKTLSEAERRMFTSYSFIDSDGWMHKLPLNIKG